MVNNQRNGRVIAIRNYLAQHPGSTGPEVADAIGAKRRDVNREINRQARLGLVTFVRANGRNRYALGRAPYAVKPKAPRRDRSAYLKARRERLRETKEPKPAKPSKHRLQHQPKTPPAPKPCQSVDDFIAHGGRVEVLPTHWVAPTRYPPVRLTYAEQA